MFAATDMPFFENCHTVASYISACARLAEFSFQRDFYACTKSFAPPNNNKKKCMVGLFTSHTNIEHQLSDQKTVRTSVRDANDLLKTVPGINSC